MKYFVCLINLIDFEKHQSGVKLFFYLCVLVNFYHFKRAEFIFRVIIFKCTQVFRFLFACCKLKCTVVDVCCNNGVILLAMVRKIVARIKDYRGKV